MKINDSLNFVIESLEKNHIVDYEIEAYILLEYVLDRSKAWIISHGDESLDIQQKIHIENLVKERIKRIPLAYIVGKKDFYKSTFKVTCDTLIPRPETEVLVKMSLDKINELNKSEINILEIGTGTGCISISIAKELANSGKRIKIIATDISSQALEVANTNYSNIIGDPNLDVSIEFVEADIVPSHLEKDSILFDLIISNPPYIPRDNLERLQEEVKKEPQIALDGGKDGMEMLRKIILQTSGLISADGEYMFEIDQSYANEFADWLSQNKFQSKILKDQFNMDRFIVCRFI